MAVENVENYVENSRNRVDNHVENSEKLVNTRLSKSIDL